jgi:hypothetical protein
MPYTYTRNRTPGIVQVGLELRLRRHGTPAEYDMTVTLGYGSIVISPDLDQEMSEVYRPAKFNWQFFTLQLDRPIDVSNPWGL